MSKLLLDSLWWKMFTKTRIYEKSRTFCMQRDDWWGVQVHFLEVTSVQCLRNSITTFPTHLQFHYLLKRSGMSPRRSVFPHFPTRFKCFYIVLNLYQIGGSRAVFHQLLYVFVRLIFQPSPSSRYHPKFHTSGVRFEFQLN